MIQIKHIKGITKLARDIPVIRTILKIEHFYKITEQAWDEHDFIYSLIHDLSKDEFFVNNDPKIIVDLLVKHSASGLLKMTRYKRRYAKRATYQTCSICLGFLPRNCTTLDCKHKFHTNCITRYQQTKRGCCPLHPHNPQRQVAPNPADAPLRIINLIADFEARLQREEEQRRQRNEFLELSDAHVMPVGRFSLHIENNLVTRIVARNTRINVDFVPLAVFEERTQYAWGETSEVTEAAIERWVREFLE